ncbi:30S ribosomal protein S4 [Candidatus Falkowbacteria bacterium]|nr:MAG: 30S ribosomal protein S4 [Candidatus Falkowbacteria bacterium]
MAKDINPKCKQCRRAGEKLYFKGERCFSPKCAMVKRNYPPGFHGPKGKKRITDYGQQLSEKQKAKRQYGLLEKQFKLTFEKALRQGGNTGHNFLKLLEMRFDNVVYRLGLARSRSEARQLINHGHFTVNGQKVNIPSYNTRTGDEIKIKSNKKDIKIFKGLPEKLKNAETPGWLNFDSKNLDAKVLHGPGKDSITPNFNMQMIIEYYSR